MTSIPQTNFATASYRMPSRGLHSDIIALMLHPVMFFKALRRKRNTHTMIVGLLIITSLVVVSLQVTSAPADTSVAPIFDMPPDSFPVDPGMMPPDSVSSSNTGDTSTLWMTALTVIGAQFISWLTLTVWLAQVQLAYKRKPNFGKNLEIVIWSSIPLTLMVLLQIIYIAAGGTITDRGFSGFLDEWAGFADLHILFQGWLYAFASQITLFWMWHIALLYIGTRYVLNARRGIVLFAIVTWILGATLISSIPHYQMFKAQLLTEVPGISEESMMDDMPSIEDNPELETPIVPDIEGEMS